VPILLAIKKELVVPEIMPLEKLLTRFVTADAPCRWWLMNSAATWGIIT
jgi:hypothetical protein